MEEDTENNELRMQAFDIDIDDFKDQFKPSPIEVVNLDYRYIPR
jgi:hypothetical protein